MTCRYCKKFKSVTLASGDYPKGKYKEERLCPYKDLMVHRDDDIFKKVPVPGEKGKYTKEYCVGFELAPTFYCTEGYTVSVEGCIKRQNDMEESQCYRCTLKEVILELRKISFFMARKREKAAKRPKPIVR